MPERSDGARADAALVGLLAEQGHFTKACWLCDGGADQLACNACGDLLAQGEAEEAARVNRAEVNLAVMAAAGGAEDPVEKKFDVLYNTDYVDAVTNMSAPPAAAYVTKLLDLTRR